MASPFRVFRKYQKTVLVIAGVVCMFVFVIGDSLVAYLTGARSARAGDERDARSVAVHWNGGSLTNRQLNDLVVRRRILNGFLKQVEYEGGMTSARAGVEPPELRVQRLLGPETPQQGVEQSVVQSKLFADAAREAGMKVSNDTILQYLDELGRRNVSRNDMRKILTRLASGGGHASIDYVIDAIREEMLAQNYLASNQFAFATVTPQQRWKDWLRVNDRMVIEAAGFPAESFLNEVKDPTEADISALFEQYKNHEASPDFVYGTTELPSPTPGFRIPRKIDLQFVEASYDDYLTKAEEKVTDAEIAKYYEEHKKLFEKADTGLMEEGKKKENAKQDKAAAKPADAEKKSTEPPEKKGEASPAKSDDAPRGKTDAPPPAKGDEAPPAKTDNKGDSAPSSKNGKSETAPGEEKKSSSNATQWKKLFRLTAFEQDAEKKKGDADKASTPDSSKSDAPAEKSAPTSDTKPAPSADAKSAPPPADAKSAPATSGAPASAAPADKDKKPAKPVQYQPLSEVKDVIRRQLAEGKVAEQLSELAGQIHGQVEGEFDTWFNATLAAQTDKQEPPAPPKSLTDLAPLAAKNGLKHVRTGPKSLLELRDMPLGKSSVADSGRPLLQLLFVSRELDLYQPVITVDLDGNRYIVMKMSDTPGRVPTLAEVRDDVIKAWKRQQAAEIAKKHAEEFAKKAQEAKQPLASVAAESQAVKVVRTDPFSELTGGDVSIVNGQLQQQPYRISQPSEIVAAGPDLLKRVFELKDGEVAVAMNHDHSIAYAVRPVEHQPPLPELRNAYLAEANNWPGLYTMTQNHANEVRSSLAHDILATAELKWDRTPDRSKEEQQDQEEGG